MSRITNARAWTVAAVLGFAFGISAAATIRADDSGSWSADAAHTEINFAVTHFFTPVTGSFEDYEVKLDYDAQHPEASSLEARIRVASVKTGNQERDDHLRTADWFDADTHPYITFTSTSVRQVDEGQLIVSGPLTIKGISHQVDLPVTILGTQTIPEPMQQMVGGAKEIASFQASTSIDRGDFDVGTGSWAATLVVGGGVDIELLLEGHYK